MKTLKDSLVDYDLALLRAIAEQRQVELESNIQREAVDQLAEELKRPESVEKALELLSPEEREALDNLLAWGGKVKASLFTRRYGPIRPFGPGRLSRERPWLNPAGPAERLWFLGLIFRGFEPSEEGLVEVVYIPEDVIPLLPVPPAEEPPFPVETVPEPPATKPARPYLLEALFLYLVYLQREEVPFTEGELPQQHREAILGLWQEREVLPLPWEDHFFSCVHHLANGMELLHIEGGLLKPHPPTARRWLKAPSWERLAQVWQSWLENTDWNELWELPTIYCEDTGWRNDPRLARRRIASFLARCPQGQWISISSFIQAVKEVEPDFQRPNGDYHSWYIREPGTDHYLMGFEHWDEIEGALIAFLISGPLYWMGTLSLGYEGEEKPVSFRLSSLGEALLGLVPAPLPEPEQPITVQRDFTILVPREASLYDRFQVERFATWTGTTERHYNYIITKSSLAGALQRGIKVDMILAFLKRATGEKVPSNVAQALRRWGKRYGRLRLRRLVVIEAPDEATMQHLQESPQLSPYIRELLTSKTAIVAEEDLPRLLKALGDMGYTLETEGLE